MTNANESESGQSKFLNFYTINDDISKPDTSGSNEPESRQSSFLNIHTNDDASKPDTSGLKWLDPTEGETCTIENEEILSFIPEKGNVTMLKQRGKEYVFGEGCKSNIS